MPNSRHVMDHVIAGNFLVNGFLVVCSENWHSSHLWLILIVNCIFCGAPLTPNTLLSFAI
jgi:hypothetical protein